MAKSGRKWAKAVPNQPPGTKYASGRKVDRGAQVIKNTKVSSDDAEGDPV